MSTRQSLIPVEKIERLILLIRGKRVMLDSDLARLYGVATKALNQAVKRNQKRFPPDFMFRLNEVEKNEVVTNCDHLSRLRFSPVLPHAFTEHGAIMLANVLNSDRAVEASVQVVRAFVRLREMLTRDLVAACHPIGIRVLDHLIVAENGHYSFADEGLLDELSLETLSPTPARNR